MGDLPHQVQESPRLLGIPCWLVPVFAGLAWCFTLSGLLITWVLMGSPHYIEMSPNQQYAYISDTGTSWWGKPLFIAGACVTVFLFTSTFFTERYLRHRGDLLHAGSKWNTVFSTLASFFMIMGGSGLILLAIFDARRHISVHFPMIGLFIAGYILAAIFMCIEKRRIARKFPHNILIKRSWQLKLFFIALEGGIALIFGITFGLGDMGTRNASVFLEWTVAFLLVFYMWSFTVDFLPVPRDAEGRLLKRAAGMVAPDDDEGDKVELVTDPEKLWDREMGLARPDSAAGWTIKSEKSISITVTAQRSASESSSSSAGSKQSVRSFSRPYCKDDMEYVKFG